jgi:hypothetical protein
MNPRLIGRKIARVAADQNQAVDLGRSLDQQVGQAQSEGLLRIRIPLEIGK